MLNRKETKVCIPKLCFRRPNISSFTEIFNFPFGSRKKRKLSKTIIAQNKALKGLCISETALLMIHSQWSVLLFFMTLLHTHFQLNSYLVCWGFFTVILYKRLWRLYSSSESPFFMGHPELHSQELAEGIHAPSPPSWPRFCDVPALQYLWWCWLQVPQTFLSPSIPFAQDWHRPCRVQKSVREM